MKNTTTLGRPVCQRTARRSGLAAAEVLDVVPRCSPVVPLCRSLHQAAVSCLAVSRSWCRAEILSLRRSSVMSCVVSCQVLPAAAAAAAADVVVERLLDLV